MQALLTILNSLRSYRLIRLCLGLVFVWAGMAKLVDPESFADIISAYELVPASLLLPAAIGLPALELIAGLGLIFDVRGSLSVILGLLILFAFVLWFGILKDLDIDCGCFSVEELRVHADLRSALYRDLGMMVAVAYLFWWRRATRSIPRGGIRLKSTIRNFVKGGSERMCNRKASFVFLVCLTWIFGAASSGLCFGKKELETEQGAVKLLREVERGGYKIVTTEELKSWIDEKKDMVVIDTMPYEASYRKNHVPGAVQFLFPKAGDMKEWDISETDGKTKEVYVKLLGADKNKTIVVYCGFVKCDRSHNGAMWAVKLGYTDVYRYPGGIKAWQEADYPTGKVE